MKKTLLIILAIISISLFSNEKGYASWYGGKFQGRQTANGEIFDTNKLTAAHKTLPFNTKVKVVNLDNGKSVVVRINDRGPFVKGRIIDLSKAAAKKLDMMNSGVAPVKLEILGTEEARENYLIQIASFKSKEYAANLYKKLRQNNVKTQITKNKSGIYRVVIKDLKKDELPHHKNKLSKLGYSNILVKRIKN